MVIEDMLELGVAAMLPVYEGGNVTRLIASDGTEMVDSRTCRTVLKYFARLFGIDLSAVRKSYGKAINKRHAVPIPFGANMILVPVKIRKNPLGENDGTFGYVNFKEVLRIDGENCNFSHITLKCGKTVDILSSRSTMLEYMKNARLVESLYMQRHFYGASAECKGASFSSPIGQEQDVLREGRDNLRFIKEKGLLGENLQDQDDLLRIYLLELLVKVLLQHKDDKNPR
ncbi:MAG: hypothetical protein PWQ97_597 [Tepidanaerobacteraceae bacterium]|nr:hypothetical protein [Tepidanaerobacteraceae bacterium]